LPIILSYSPSTDKIKNYIYSEQQGIISALLSCQKLIYLIFLLKYAETEGETHARKKAPGRETEKETHPRPREGSQVPDGYGKSEEQCNWPFRIPSEVGHLLRRIHSNEKNLGSKDE